jgi:hypothetical protein
VKKAILGFGAVAAILLTSGAALAASTSESAVALSFHQLPSVRVLDTRVGGSPLQGQKTLDVVIPDLPSDAASVAINLTVVDGSQPSFLVLYPTGTERPGTSSINWNGSGAVANQTSVKLPSNHSVTVFNSQGKVNVVIDLLGYYSPSPVAAGAQGPQGPKGEPATTTVNLSGAWTATNGTVKITPNGVAFGPYADGGAANGSVCYAGLNGKTLADVQSLSFYARYVADTDTGGVGVPYLRIFLNNNANDMIFSANTQTPNPDMAQGPFHEWVTTAGSWRYQDDIGDGPDSPFATLQAAHATEVISKVCISTGFTSGTNLAALLRWAEVNGQTFTFRG